MPPPRIVTLTTDFGTRDTFVGQMKAAALAVHPELTLVDLTHEVPAHDVAAGAFLLKTGYRAFPPGTIHVAVVDPGVGTARRAVAVRTEHYYFVAPDNGVLTRVLDEERLESAYVLQESHYRRPQVAPTFEGRDVLAPAAAWIARGTDMSHFGPPAGELVRLPGPRVRLEPGRPVRIRVLVVDRFGNATLDLARETLAPLTGAAGLPPPLRLETPGGVVEEFRRTYGEGEGEGPFLLFNSADHLEVAIRNARADEKLGLKPGVEATLTVTP